MNYQRLKRYAYLMVLITAVLCSLDSSSKPLPRAGPQNKRLSVHPWVAGTLQRLSLETKIGQMLQVRYYADYISPDDAEYAHLLSEMQKYHIGSVVFGMHFNQAGPIRSSPVDAAKVANQLQRTSQLPLLLAADLERGVAHRQLSSRPAGCGLPRPAAEGYAFSLAIQLSS